MAKTTLKVKLVGEDGNAFHILSKVSRALRKWDKDMGATEESGLEGEFLKEATSGDYDHLLVTVMDYVEVE